jgi:hypothetical protein
MRAVWNAADFRRVSTGDLRFAGEGSRPRLPESHK